MQRTSGFLALLATNSPLLFNRGPAFSSVLVVYNPEKSFPAVFDISSHFQVQLSFYFSNCTSAHSGNALVALSGYLLVFPSLLHTSFGFEQPQELAVKSRGSLTPPTPLPFKGDELVSCFQKSILQEFPALTSSFIPHGSFPWNPSQLCSEQPEAGSLNF